MKVSLNLLKEFADFEEPVERIIERIGERIGEVESVERLGPIYTGIVVARIIDSRPHPDADKLSVNQVDIGGRRPVQVIAGDKTLAAGDKTAYIPPGTVVPGTVGGDELTIAVRDIRGQTSRGMLASERELNFAPTHVGVLKLDTAAPPGTALVKAYKLDDHIIEVETKVLTHRPDTFGHLGFARELSAALGHQFTSPKWYLTAKPAWPRATPKLGLSLDNRLPKLVPRFTLAAYRGAISGPSPVQIQSWLTRLGIRPLNNLVDLTNYLMILSGQPLHAYDYDKVASGAEPAQFVVRLAKPGERLELLDGRTIKLNTTDVVIADDRRAIGLGGVMGGADTEVDDSTKNVVIEAANFDMYAVRNTAMAHGVQSEAVTRFARGQDPAPAAAVQAYAVGLMQDWAGAKPASGLIDDYPRPRRSRPVSAQAANINRLLGLEETPASMARALSRAELKTSVKRRRLEIVVPTWRPDLNIEADIAEEVGRLGGYRRISARLPKRPLTPSGLAPLGQLERDCRRYLSAAGANEVLTYSGVPERLLRAAQQDPSLAYRIRNAISPDVELMRLSLLPGLLDKVNPNLRQGHDQFALFELGVVHHRQLIEQKLPEEQPVLGLVYSASQAARPDVGGAAYFQAQKYLSYLLACIGHEFKLLSSAPAGDPWLAQTGAPFSPQRRAYVSVGGQTVGVIGEFKPSVKREAKLPKVAAGWELHLGRLSVAAKTSDGYRPLSKFPSLSVDLTLKSPIDLPYAKLAAALAGARPPGIDLDWWPLDIFQPDKSHKHTSFRLVFTSSERTLTQAEVNQLLAKMVKSVAKRTGATQV